MSSVILPTSSRIDEVEPPLPNRSVQTIVKEVVPSGLMPAPSAASIEELNYRHFQSEMALDLWMFGAMFAALGFIVLIGFGSLVATGGLFVLGAGAIGLGYWVRPGAH